MRIVFLTASILFTLTVCVRADTVHMKDGRKLEGEIVSESEEKIELKMKYGTMTLRRSDIERIVKGNASGEKDSENKPERQKPEAPSDSTDRDNDNATSPAAWERRLQRRIKKLVHHVVHSDTRRLRDKIIEIGRPAVEPLLEKARDRDSWVGYKAVEILGELGDKSAVLPLMGMLRSGIGDRSKLILRQSAAKALGEIGDKRAVDPLVATLKEDSGYVSREACIALGKLGDRKAVKPLIEKLDSPSADMRLYAVKALAGIGDKSAIPHVEKMFSVSDEEKKATKPAAAFALVKLREDKKAREYLLQAANDKSHYARTTCMEYLSELQDERVIPLLIRELASAWMSRATRALIKIGEPAVQPLRRIAQAPVDMRARQNALWALGEIGSKSVVEPLIEIFKDRNCNVRGRALTALSKIGDKRAVDPLLAMLDTEKEYAVGIAVFAAEMGDKRTIEPLIKVIREDNRSRSYAKDALLCLGKDAVKPFVGLLTGNNKDIVACAADALAELGYDEAVEPLAKLLKNNSWDFRQAGLAALADIGSDKAITALSGALEHKDGQTRMKAVDSLGLTCNESAVAPLTEVMLKHENERMRAQAARMLGELGCESAVQPLVKALKDKSERVSSEALKALSAIGGEKAYKAFLEVIKSGDGDARKGAITALAELGGTGAIDILVRLLKDNACRSDASRALRKIGEPAISALIEALNQENSAVRSAAARVLKWITGEDFGTDHKKWHDWWQERK